ncbi:MAG: hypothetical protein OXI60_04650 [Acidiferrobacterales bacterium]|nr:hypothetical protein [Acidiferrobacterales bacterium]
MKTLLPLLCDVEIDKSQTFRNLSMYPLQSATGSQTVDYTMFNAQVDTNRVRIVEKFSSQDNSDLKVGFTGDRRYLILDGDGLPTPDNIYICATSALLPAGEVVTLPVYDLKQGRWIHESDTIQHFARNFLSSGTSEKAQARRPESRSSEVAIEHDNRQEKQAQMDRESTHYTQNKAKLQDYLDNLTVLASHIGAIFVVNGEVAGIDLFENDTIFASQLASLIDCYAADPLKVRSTISKRKSKNAAAAFLSEIRNTPIMTSPTPGDGEGLRFESTTLIGGALRVDKRVVHLCAMPESAAVNTTEFRARKSRAQAAANRA